MPLTPKPGAAARAARKRRAAERAAEDPIRLARAARIVRAALARQMLTPADLLDEGADREESLR